MIVRPFIYSDGIPTMRDSDIKLLFQKMVRDKTDSMVFYDGSIKTDEQFLRFVKSPEILLYAVYENEDPIACGWLNNFEHNTAYAHFCIFSEAWDRSVEVGKLLIETAMKSTGIDMAIGKIPKFNGMALEFVQKCGAKILGELPYGCVVSGKSHPATIVYYTR